MVGYLGKIIFETSDSRIMNFDGFKRSIASRFATQEVIKEKPKTEYLGKGLQEISFTVNLNGNHGVKPRAELEKWEKYAEDGEAHILVIGGKPLGSDRWVIKSTSEAWNTIFNQGELFSAVIEVSLEEYISNI